MQAVLASHTGEAASQWEVAARHARLLETAVADGEAWGLCLSKPCLQTQLA